MKHWWLTLLCLTSLSAFAASQDEFSTVRLSSFGTIGAVRSDDDGSEFVPSPRYKEGATTHPNWQLDSSLGAQAVADLNSRLTATLQVLSRRELGRNYRPRTEWAFLAYKFNDHATVRAGRVGTPFFLVSDYRNLNAANPWLRPPVDVYGQIPVSWADGGDIILRETVGKNRFSMQMFAGRSASEAWANAEFTVEVSNLLGMNVVWERDAYLLRISHSSGKVTVDNFDGLNQFVDILQSDSLNADCPTCASLADHYAIDRDNISFDGIGFQADWSNVLVMAELTRRLAPSIMADTRGWYFTAVYRMKKFSPYMTWSHISQTSPTQDIFLPEANSGLIDILREAADSALGDVGQSTQSIGVRYDISDTMDIKVQLDHVRTADPYVAGYNVASQPNFDGRYNLLSAALDFAF